MQAGGKDETQHKSCTALPCVTQNCVKFWTMDRQSVGCSVRFGSVELFHKNRGPQEKKKCIRISL